MPRGILAYASYLPVHRLDLAAVAAALDIAPKRGVRTVAGYDEDSTSMAVEAARQLASLLSERPDSGTLYLATSTPAYADKTNATAVHAALGLPLSWRSVDVAGLRGGGSALGATLEGSGTALVVAADVRAGRPGGTDELDGGDGAAAFLIGDGDDDSLVAELVGASSSSVEVLDRWRLPSERSSSQWEGRFGRFALEEPALDAVDRALKAAAVTRGDIRHVVVSSGHPQVRASIQRALASDGAEPVSVGDGGIGHAGAADVGLRLAAALDACAPGDLVAAVSIADGVDVVLLRATASVAANRQSRTVASALAGKPVSYPRFLAWRGFLDREPPRRPEPDAPAAPPALRTAPWKYGFLAGRCGQCGTRHLPPNPTCASCGAVGAMEPEPMANVRGVVRTFTIDWLAYSPSPPVVRAVVDFDGGGRFTCELTDVDHERVALGDAVEMTFRRLYTTGNTHNYFWKARPLREEQA